MKDYQVSNNAKIFTTILMVVGLVLLGIGLIVSSGDGLLLRRFMSNLLTNSFFFITIALGAMFFLALQYAAEVGWYAYIKRVIEAITGFIPVGIALMLVTLVTFSFTHGAGIYNWMSPHFMEEGAHHYTEVNDIKGMYLNLPFFWIRAILYFVFYYFMWKGFMKRSLQQDENPDDAERLHKKNYHMGALFIVGYAFFSTSSAWDWIMSIDMHWYSTVFGWYTFSGAWITAMVTILLLLLYLKKLGYLPKLNDSHIHNVGLWVFAISFLWSYLWFAQFMLIWYVNMPEEVTYYIMRIDHYKILYFTMFIVNFAFPMLILMSRDAKRHTGALAFVGICIIIGHWLDVWIMISGGSMGPTAHIGLLTIGMAVVFFGLFIRVVLGRLEKAPLIAKNEPYLEESIHHEI